MASSWPSWVGECIIYYGTLEVFNAKAFIFYDIDNPAPALKEIQYLNTNTEAYQRKLEEPILRNVSLIVLLKTSSRWRIDGTYPRHVNILPYCPSMRL
jgi:hypothetical protein